jgi:hypothetical protein
MTSRRPLLVLTGAVVTLACAASGPALDVTSPTDSAPEGWLIYSDSTHGFAIGYPPDYVLLPETTSPPAGAIKRVRFQSRRFAGAGAELEPPRFTVDVFPASQASLVGWLRATDRLAPGADLTSLTLPGALEGARVRQPQQLAPDEFWYYATAQYIYALTPLGEHGPSMLSSFRLR